MNSVFDQWREAARRKAAELDEKYDLKSKLEQSVNAASDVVTQAGSTVNKAANVAREKASQINTEYGVTDNLRNATAQAEETFRQGARAAQTSATEAAQTAEQTAREVFGNAQTYYKRAEQAYQAGASGARLTEAALSGFQNARVWIKENPGKATAVTFSLIAGVRAGSALPGLGATVLGSTIAGNWFFHSALPIVGLRKLTEHYTEYLKEQEQRLASGQMDDAQRAQLEFQQKLTKYVGAPLLGAFSVAAGATLIGAAFSGATVTGFPLNLIIGGNPLLNGIWFFANGVICISEGYKFFMIALADEAEVQRVVREIKGLLPAAATA